MAVNDQYVPGASKFFGSVPDGTGAPGSPGATEADALPDSGLSTQRTAVYESVQNRPAPSAGVGFDDTAEPGQNREGISGLGPDFIANTGAGQGTAGHAPHPGPRP